ncbi:gastrula zinc finger protein XlCGF46.1-like [Littorina saxatilis]|uniref:gastrula zinc finger protein XlCGF46.1-like n=1 Tax=Littorina saxatilis TaxID=31220 RepID=UPI0038B47163
MLTTAVKGELYWCPVCHSTFADHKTYLAHVKRSHPQSDLMEKFYILRLEEMMAEKKLVYESGAEVSYYQCLTCLKVHRTLYLMTDHLRVTTDGTLTCRTSTPGGSKIRKGAVKALFCPRDRPTFPCEKCGRSLSTKAALVIHLANKHVESKEKNHVCEVCQKSFLGYRQLKLHKKKHNRDQKKLMCGICGNVYWTHFALTDHIDRKHTSNKFVCPVCNKLCCAKRVLNAHMKTHSKDKQAVFPCSHCKLKFTKPYNLKVHQRIHSGEKPYKCNVCEAAYAQKNSLNVHMRKHGIEIQKPREVDELEKETVMIPPTPPKKPLVLSR